MIVTFCNDLVIFMIFKSSKRIKSFFAGLLAIVLVFNLSFALFETPAEAVSQSEINALKKQQEKLAGQKADLQKQADDLGGKVSSQTEKLAILNAKLDVTNAELDNLSEQIAIYIDSIADMENELNLQEQKEQELLERFKKRIQIMEENGTYSYLSLIFGATSFVDLLARVDCVGEIMEYDNRLVVEVQEAQVSVENAQLDLEAEMAAQELVFASYEQKQADLQAQQEEAAVVLSSLKADSADYQQQLDSVKALQSSLNTKISKMEHQLAEQERIKAEQAAARAAASSGNNKWYGDVEGSGTGQDIVNYAKQFLGVKYVYGGTSPSGFDCSGLVYYCYRNFGYRINRTASGQARNGVAVSSSELAPGDIIIFTAQSGGYIGHCGIYIGNGQFIHAPHTGDVVKISSLTTGYYKNHYWGARRIIS